MFCLKLNIKGMKLYFHTETCTSMLTAVLFEIAKNCKQLRYPSAVVELNKLRHMHTRKIKKKSGIKENELLIHSVSSVTFQGIRVSGKKANPIA